MLLSYLYLPRRRVGAGGRRDYLLRGFEDAFVTIANATSF
jgi:hypothetical protein